MHRARDVIMCASLPSILAPFTFPLGTKTLKDLFVVLPVNFLLFRQPTVSDCPAPD